MCVCNKLNALLMPVLCSLCSPSFAAAIARVMKGSASSSPAQPRDTESKGGGLGVWVRWFSAGGAGKCSPVAFTIAVAVVLRMPAYNWLAVQRLGKHLNGFSC